MITTRYRGRRVHLMGIGGAGVSALVPLLQRVGAAVDGCDLHESPVLERLRAGGVPCAIGHHPDHVERADAVVHSAAIDAAHPELEEARRRGLPVLTRGECLISLMEGSRTLAVAGSHGKTSTTWMAAHLVTACGLDPVVMVGGAVPALDGSGGRAGASDLFIAEVDESDGSFAGVAPEVAVVTNLDDEHLRHYGGSRAALLAAFRRWLERLPAHGAAVLPSEGLPADFARGLRCRVIRVGLQDGDWQARDLALAAEHSRLRVWGDGADLGEITVPLPGVHMALNALMACAAVRHLVPGCPLSALDSCERVRRRFTVHGRPRGVRVVEDYGHHPTEIRATIAAARLAGGRVHVLFQPHRYTRTVDCFAGFVAAFDQAHAVAVLPVYPAGEAPLPGPAARELAEALAERRGGDGSVAFCPDTEAAIAHVLEAAAAGDTVLVLGAGDVGRLAPRLVARLDPAPPRGAA